MSKQQLNEILKQTETLTAEEKLREVLVKVRDKQIKACQ